MTDAPLHREATGGARAEPVSRRTGFVEHDGESIYWEVVGEGGVPLVLSHGAGGSTDRAGRSGPEVAGGDLLAILDHLGIERADLVGQSMGGWTTVGAVLERPGLARSVVLADTLGGITSPSIEAATTGATRAQLPADAASRLGIHPAIDPSFARRDEGIG